MEDAIIRCRIVAFLYGNLHGFYFFPQHIILKAIENLGEILHCFEEDCWATNRYGATKPTDYVTTLTCKFIRREHPQLLLVSHIVCIL
jgi:hypothetical protein